MVVLISEVYDIKQSDIVDTLQLEKQSSVSCYLLWKIAIETGDSGLHLAWIQIIKQSTNFRGGSFN